MFQTLNKEQGIHWIKEERLPAFLESDLYLEYRLSKLLSQARISGEHGEYVLMKIDFKPKARKVSSFSNPSESHYLTIPTLAPEEEGFGKHLGKRRKCWKPAFSPFPTVFSTLSKRDIIILALFKRFRKQALAFKCLQYKASENTVGKGKTTRNKQFLLFPLCFLPIWRTFCHFHQI